MGKGSTKIERPEPVDVYQSTVDYARAVRDALPDILATEQAGRPEFAKLELADIETGLFGADGQAGILELRKRAGEDLADENIRQKERELGLIDQFGSDVSASLRGLADRDADEIARLQAEQAKQLFKEAQGELSPERQRAADQAARMSGFARGRGRDMSVDASALLGREDVRANLRAQAQRAGQLGFTQAQTVAGDPLQFLFGSPSQALRFGSDAYREGFQFGQVEQGPQLFDPDTGTNLALQQRSQDVSLLGAQAQADASRSAGLMGAIGTIGGGALGGTFGAKLGGSLFGS